MKTVFLHGVWLPLLLAASSFAQLRSDAWPVLGDLNAAVAVRSLMTDGANLYVGGNMLNLGGASTSILARWDGFQWHLLPEIGGNAYSMAMLGGDLYVGGGMSRPNSVEVSGLVRLESSQWMEVGGGLTRTVQAMLPTAEGLLLGGQGFQTPGSGTTQHAYRWDGSTYEVIEPELGGAVYDFVGHDGAVYALGALNAPSEGIRYVARLDGGTWAAAPVPDISGFVTTGISFEGHLFIGTQNASLKSIMRLDGSEWVTTGSPTGNARAMVVYEDQLLASVDAGASSSRIYRYTGSGWEPYSEVFDGSIQAMTVYQGRLAVGGTFSRYGGAWVNGLAVLEGSELVLNATALSSDEDVFNLLMATSGDSVAVAGNFAFLDGGAFGNIALWDGMAWDDLGGGATSGVEAAALYDGKVYAFGSNFGGDPLAHGLHVWDGEAWAKVPDAPSFNSPSLAVNGRGVMISGLQTGSPSQIRFGNGASWQSWDADGDVTGLFRMDGDLCAYGGFKTVGTAVVNGIGCWNGSAWTDLGSPEMLAVKDVSVDGGILLVWAQNNFGAGMVNAIHRYEDGVWTALHEFDDEDRASGVFVGGGFMAAGLPAPDGKSRIAYFDDFGWTSWGPAIVSGEGRFVRYRDGFLLVTDDDHRIHHVRVSQLPAPVALPAEIGPVGALPALTWGGSPRAEQYTIQIASDADFTQVLTEARVSSTVFTPSATLPSPATLHMRVRSENGWGGSLWSTAILRIDANAVSVDDGPTGLPSQLALYPVYPNPFNPTTQVRLDLPSAGAVKLEVFDVLGRRVATLLDAMLPAGSHQQSIDASSWASGVYLVRLEAAGKVMSRRMTLSK